ncbi:NAD(P)/FAD-dependent oxidoreductase [Leucobacter tenebrionis]|uniref:NAD(P)/FAD-dependent oxidoreductase n=1 Tax=Leucobacter tenebrionis TaxID=2873270 RepID=UPI001CA6048E|nr:FAD-binding oxidoreductase [Leucobacter tenebrionis]QZY51612.1 FAD-binding oxidoreductase [Leucobacter tenebrionis]
MPPSTVIIGAGPIGLLTAFELTRHGRHVTVIDRDRIGSGGSRWNAGEVVPFEVDPVASSAFLRKGARGLLSARLEPSLTVGIGDLLADPGFFTRFAWHSRPAAYEAGRRALLELAKPTFELLQQYRAEGLPMHPQGNRFLYLFESPRAARAARRNAEHGSRISGLPAPGELLHSTELRDFEPGLSDKATAGFFQSGNQYIDSNQFFEDLIGLLSARGVQFMDRTEATEVRESLDGAEVLTPLTSIPCDSVLIAAGADAGRLAERWRIRLPLRAGRGYSVRVDLPLNHRDTLLHFSESHVVASPFDREVQLAGQMNIASKPKDPASYHRRILAMAAEYLPAVAEASVVRQGAGVRPLTPDGLPYIGSLSRRVHVAAGHNMIGLTLAPTTAAAIAPLLLGEAARTNLAPFSPARFTRGA